MSKKDKKNCLALNYIDQWLILVSAITGCVSVSAFGSLVGTLVGAASSAVGLKISAITAEIERYNSIMKKKRKSITNWYC